MLLNTQPHRPSPIEPVFHMRRGSAASTQPPAPGQSPLHRSFFSPRSSRPVTPGGPMPLRTSILLFAGFIWPGPFSGTASQTIWLFSASHGSPVLSVSLHVPSMRAMGELNAGCSKPCSIAIHDSTRYPVLVESRSASLLAHLPE
jgi:hypothetical protein